VTNPHRLYSNAIMFQHQPRFWVHHGHPRSKLLVLNMVLEAKKILLVCNTEIVSVKPALVADFENAPE